MATLFFEGFNQAITLQGFDSAYWSTQYSQFPKYGFISTLPPSFESYNATRYSPFGSAFNPPSVTTYQTYGLGQLFSSEDKSYLCLYNPDYNDGTIEPPTFIRCSGFAQPSGNKTYFSLKVYGLENNSSVNSAYPYRNKFLSFCSGNTEILNFNVVRITGNFLPELNGARETLGIETIYHNNALGVFDLNIDGVQNYELANRQSTHNLMNITRGFENLGGVCGGILNKGYIHLEFLLDQTINDSGIFNLKVEGVDSSVIDTDINVQKSNWANETRGSGSLFFNNIRFYNRMAYNNYIGNTVYCQGSKATYDVNNQWIFLDDIILIDNTGNLPTSWLGTSSKIISYKPDYTAGLGLFQWTPNTTVGNIIRKTSDALDSNDGDIGYIETIDSGNVSALRFSKFTNLSSLPDGIGGIKLYNTARKESLDSQFVNVFATGISQLNNIIQYDTLILTEFGKDKNDDDTITDESPYGRLISNSGCVASRDIIKNGDSSFYFPDQSSFLSFDHPQLGTQPFTIESWVLLNNTNENFILLEQKPIEIGTSYNSYMSYKFIVDCSGINITRPSRNYSTSPEIKLLFDTVMTTGTWYHIALSKNNDQLICYKQGSSGVSYSLGSIIHNSLLNLPILFNSSPSYSGFYNIYTTDVGSQYASTYAQIGLGAAYIDNYKITVGKSLYNSNFTPPTSLTLASDYFINLGPVHNVTQSSYKTFQYYSFVNPATNKNWRVSEISGMALGVKKL